MKNRKPKADGRYVVNVSFTANETNLLEWADSHGNFSSYVKNLIEADMKKGEIPADALQVMLLNMMGSTNLKDILQKQKAEETVADIEQGQEKPQKPKVNKKAIMGIMNTKK